MRDIETRSDLEDLMAEFYTKLLHDPSISYIFTDIARIDLRTHLPKITDFWEQVMFNTGNYRSNVMQIHLELNRKSEFSEVHFKTWLTHFEKTVDEKFAGENAEKIKTRALSVATMMKLKTLYKP